MIKRELAKDPEMQNENWERFLPKFKKKNAPAKKKAKKPEKKKYDPFPPPQQPSKIDLQLESGEYFLTEQQRQQRKREEKNKKQNEKTLAKQLQRQEAFKPPKVRTATTLMTRTGEAKERSCHSTI